MTEAARREWIARLLRFGLVGFSGVGVNLIVSEGLFRGMLLGIADALVELKAVCHCGRKSSMNLRVSEDGTPVKEGEQTEVGGNDRYVALCRKHFSEALSG